MKDMKTQESSFQAGGTKSIAHQVVCVFAYICCYVFDYKTMIFIYEHVCLND